MRVVVQAAESKADALMLPSDEKHPSRIKVNNRDVMKRSNLQRPNANSNDAPTALVGKEGAAPNVRRGSSPQGVQSMVIPMRLLQQNDIEGSSKLENNAPLFVSSPTKNPSSVPRANREATVPNKKLHGSKVSERVFIPQNTALTNSETVQVTTIL